MGLGSFKNVLARYVTTQPVNASPYNKRDLATTVRPALPREIAECGKTVFSMPVRNLMMDRFSLTPEGGLRPLQAFIYSRFGPANSNAKRAIKSYSSVALWAPEMAAFGGVQSYMWRLWEMLVKAKSETTFELKGMSLKDKPHAIDTWPNSTKIRPTCMNGSRLRFIVNAVRAIGRADLVIVGHVNQSPVALLAQYCGLVRDYVVVLHGIEAWRRAGWLTRQALKRAHLVVATTRFTATICSEVNNLPADNFTVIPLCAEPDPEVTDPKFKLDGGWPILFVARLLKSESYKGLETLIDVVADLQRKQFPVKLHVVGDGDDKERLEQYARNRMSLNDAVMFHGRLSGAKIQAAYKSAKAFVMPSAKEGFGIVFLEAMRHGVPCIGGAYGGTPEVFTNGVEGLLVPFRNHGALKASILKLIEEPDFAIGLGEAGRKRFLRDYSFGSFAGHWTEMLQISQFQ